MDGLKKLENISSLRLTIKKAESFKSKQLENIIAEANRKKGPNTKAEEPPVKFKPGRGSKFSIILKLAGTR